MGGVGGVMQWYRAWLWDTGAQPQNGVKDCGLLRLRPEPLNRY